MYFSNYLISGVIFFAFTTSIIPVNNSIITNLRTVDTIPTTKSNTQKDSFFNRIYFSQSDAEKILGEKAFLSDNSTNTNKDTLEWKCAYTAQSKDHTQGRPGVVYFMLEQYSKELSAKNAYNGIKVANQNHEGVKTLQKVGDEAYFHSDNENFYFILVRKGKLMFRIKVNKITSKTSLDKFHQVSKRIADSL
jgi:hypothetical protein